MHHLSRGAVGFCAAAAARPSPLGRVRGGSPIIISNGVIAKSRFLSCPRSLAMGAGDGKTLSFRSHLFFALDLSALSSREKALRWS